MALVPGVASRRRCARSASRIGTICTEVSRFRRGLLLPRGVGAAELSGCAGVAKLPQRWGRVRKHADVWSFKMIVRTISCRTAVLLAALAVADLATASKPSIRPSSSNSANCRRLIRSRTRSARCVRKSRRRSCSTVSATPGYMDQPRSTRLGDCRRSAAAPGMADECQPAGGAPAEARRRGSRRLSAAGSGPAQRAARRRPAEGGQLQRQLARFRLAHLR